MKRDRSPEHLPRRIRSQDQVSTGPTTPARMLEENSGARTKKKQTVYWHSEMAREVLQSRKIKKPELAASTGQ